jgi:archaellum component FlaF (FlaF/FlaG flagellin family)
MRLIRNVKGISKLILTLLLLVSFIVGALLSYIWTMGDYAPQEFHLPSQSNVSIESVEFYAENASFFNVTLLNPSYSPSTVSIEQIMVSTNDGLLYNVTDTLPSLPSPLTPSNSQTFKAYWNWMNYTGQTVNVFVLVADGSGATLQKITPFMNLTITSVNFDPVVSATNFTVTVQSMGSQTFMNITRMTLNGEDVTVSPLLPYTLDANASATFTLSWDWSDLQSTIATISVETLQGFATQKSQVVPEVFRFANIIFDAVDTSSFNLTVQNVAIPQISLDISQIKVEVQGETVIIENVNPSLPCTLQPDSTVPLKCTWNWINYQGQNAIATITVYTQQGFSISAETSIP